MKTLALLFSLSLLILLNPTHSKRNPIRLPTAAHVALASDTPVLDNDLRKLRAGAVYDLMALLSPETVSFVGLRNDTQCPSDVILARRIGDPIIITPADPNATNLILESAFQNFKFHINTPSCENNVSWEIQYDPKLGQQIVKTGDVVRDLFKIERAPQRPDADGYIIRYCPAFDVCYNVHIYDDHSIRATRLVLSRDNFTRFGFEIGYPVVLDTDGEEVLPGEV